MPLWQSFLERLRSFTSVSTASSVEAILKDALKRRKLMSGSFILGAAGLTYFLFASNSVHYSLFDVVFPQQPQGGATPLFELYGVKATEKGFAKLLGGLAAIGLFWALIELNEPLSDRALFVDLASSGMSYKWRWIYRGPLAPLRRDLAAYADSLPSMHFDSLCYGCGNNLICPNVVLNRENYVRDHSVQIWNSVLVEMRPTLLANLLTATLRCRFVHYARVVGLWAGYMGLLFYFIHRGVEHAEGLGVQWLAPSIFVTAGCFVVVPLLGFLNSGSSHHNRLGGVWARFREAGKDAATSREAKASHTAVFQSRVCTADGNTHRYSRSEEFKESRIHQFDARLARGLLLSMNDLVIDKLSRFLSGGDNAPARHVDGVISAMQSYFKEVFSSAHSCEVRRFESLEDIYQHYRAAGNHRDDRNKIEADLTTYDVHVCSSDGAGRTLLDAAGGSLVIAPVRLEVKHVEALSRVPSRHRDRVGRRRLTFNRRGYIVIRSGDPRAFSVGDVSVLRLALAPFVHRLTYEIMRNELSAGGRS